MWGVACIIESLNYLPMREVRVAVDLPTEFSKVAVVTSCVKPTPSSPLASATLTTSSTLFWPPGSSPLSLHTWSCSLCEMAPDVGQNTCKFAE